MLVAGLVEDAEWPGRSGISSPPIRSTPPPATTAYTFFLIVPNVIVLRPLCARCQLELIDPKTGDAELIRQRTKDPVSRLHLTHVNHLI